MPRKPRSAKGPSEVITLRLTPEARFGLELAARRTGQKFSQLIQTSAEGFCADTPVWEGTTAEQAAEQAWAETEEERIINIALEFPDLLRPHERSIWDVVKNAPGLWNGKVRKGNLRNDLLVKHWESIEKVARCEKGAKLPASLLKPRARRNK